MAESQSSDGKFPPEIVASDDDPSRGFYTLTLMIPGLKTKKGVFDKNATVTNGDCKIEIKQDIISVSATVNDDGGKTTKYFYSKKLPENISDLRSKHKLKNGQAILILAKTEKVSWGQHDTYFLKKT